MSENQTRSDTFFDKYKNFLKELVSKKYEVEASYKYRDFYGEWGMACVHYINPYLWVLPLMAAILLVVTFKKQQMFGQLQKCLTLIMAIDVFFAMSIGIKDAIFNLLNWNYGLVEFKLCMFMLVLIRLQTAVHGTSLWIKSLMLLHRVIMFLSPFKFRQMKYRLFLIPFVSLHALIVIVYCALVNNYPLRSFSTMQEYTPGMKLKKIDACTLEPRIINRDRSFYSFVQYFSFFSQTIYLTFLPFFIHCICIVLLIYLVKREMTRISHLAPMCSSKALKNVKYLILLKIHIYLGLSFILQETPILVASLLGNFGKNLFVTKVANSVVLIYMFQTFAIGKPIDLLIYASLSQKVKSELLNIVCCKKERKQN